MQYGMPSLIECKGIEENVRLCRKFGLDFIELNMNLPMFQPDELPRAIDYAQKHGVGITIHADENLDCMDFSAPVANAYLSVLIHTVQIARECGVPTVNLHLSRGVYFSLPDRKTFLYDVYRDRYLARVQEMRDRCAEAAGNDVCVLIENTNGFLPFQKAAIELLLKRDAFGLTWDIGHSQTAVIDDASFLIEHLNRIGHFHIHDARGGECHLALDTGETDIRRYLALAEERNARCIIEVKTAEALVQSVAWIHSGE